MGVGSADKHLQHVRSCPCQTRHITNDHDHSRCCISTMAHSSGAWAASMHEVEEGTLSWANTTQWSLNRLSASQIAMTNITTVPQGKRQCRYYNEGTCSHEGSHGNYSHTCSYCSKQGCQSAHPETKCSFKARSFNKSNTVNH